MSNLNETLEILRSYLPDTKVTLISGMEEKFDVNEMVVKRIISSLENFTYPAIYVLIEKIYKTLYTLIEDTDEHNINVARESLIKDFMKICDGAIKLLNEVRLRKHLFSPALAKIAGKYKDIKIQPNFEIFDTLESEILLYKKIYLMWPPRLYLGRVDSHIFDISSALSHMKMVYEHSADTIDNCIYNGVLNITFREEAEKIDNFIENFNSFCLQIESLLKLYLDICKKYRLRQYGDVKI